MRIWAVSNQKGGVGKTTTAVALAGLLAESGARVLLVDLDPHGSLTTYVGYNPETVPHSAFELFAEQMVSSREAVQALVLSTRDAGVHLLAASPALATVERRSLSGTGVRVSKALALLWDDFDYALIDTPPVLGVLMVNALAACEKLLIPVQTEFLALKGLERMLRTLEMMARSQQRPLPYLIVPTLFDRRTHASVSSLRSLRNDYATSTTGAASTIWAGMIPVDTRFRDASRVGLLPSQFDAKCRGVEAYRALLKVLLSAAATPATIKSGTALR